METFAPKIIFTDITPLPLMEQMDKIEGFRDMCRRESRKQNYPNKFRDYHYHCISNRVVNMVQLIAECLARPEIKSSPYIIMGNDYYGFFLYASVSKDTILEWTWNV